MPVWEQILLIACPAALIIFGITGLFGRTSLFSRLVFFFGAVFLAGFLFRFGNFFPEPSFIDYLFPVDLNVALALAPFTWLLFSLVFAREEHAHSIKRYKIGLTISGLLTVVFLITGLSYPLLVLQNNYPETHKILVTRAGLWYFLFLIVISAMIMINLESTFRASWGVYRRKLVPPMLTLGILFVCLLIGSSMILLNAEIYRQFIGVFAVLSTLSAGFSAYYFVKYHEHKSGVYVRIQAVYSSIGIIIIGFYMVLAGAIGKVIQIIGGDIKLFISVLGALIAFLILLSLVLSRSIKERIKTTLDKSMRSGELDFEDELALFSEEIATVLNPEELTDKILQILKDKLGVGKIYLFYTDPHQEHLVLSYPKHEDIDSELKISVSGKFADWLFRHGEATVMEDLERRLQSGKEYVQELEMLRKLELAITLPLIAKRKLVGILFLGPKVSGEQFGHQEIQFITSIGHQYALALFSARLSEELLASKQIESFHKFTTFVMHDLKNSVSMLSMLLQNYENNKDNPEFQKSAMTTINGAVKRMQTVMEKLRSGEEIERFQISDCDLNKIVLSLENSLELKNRSGIRYESHLTDDAVVEGDSEKLSEVVRNLILNSLEAMNEGGELTVGTETVNGRVVLSVKDSGEGMTSEFISRKLFKPFSTTKKKGLGIGLFQSKEWIEKMGGRIVVKSSPQTGTTMELVFKRT